MRDPYETLGLRRTATAEEIKRAYRRLAKKLHPDLNPGKAAIEQQFKEATAAYELLSDPEKRARFDRGEIDAAGAERGFRWNPRGGAGGARVDDADVFVEDIIADIFRAQRGGAGARQRGPARGSDATFKLAVPFLEAVLGARKRVTLGDGKAVDITVPAGIESGQTLRLKGQGAAGRHGGAAGDALVELVVEPHERFTRSGADIRLDLPVSLPEAVLGATATVPTIHGPVALKIPPGSNTGTVLRLKGKGVPARGGKAAGDQYVTLRIVLPDPPDPELARFLENWSRNNRYEVR